MLHFLLYLSGYFSLAGTGPVCACACVVLMLKDNTGLYDVFTILSGLALAAVSSCAHVIPKELSDYYF